jgi:hypothetical protein
MKKSARRSHPSEPTHEHARASQKKRSSDGPWEFISSGRLFPMSSGNSVRAAYRSASGEMRFIPI